MLAHQVDVAVPHARHQNFDVRCFDMAECFGEVGVKTDVLDLFVFDYEPGILDGFASAGDEKVGCYCVCVTLLGVIFGCCSDWDGDLIDVCPVFLEVCCHDDIV